MLGSTLHSIVTAREDQCRMSTLCRQRPAVMWESGMRVLLLLHFPVCAAVEPSLVPHFLPLSGPREHACSKQMKRLYSTDQNYSSW